MSLTDIRWVDDREVIEWEKVTGLLQTAHWSKGITREEVEIGARNSAVAVAAYAGDALVGYARAVSDRVRYGYIMDVFVDPEHRHQGIGRALVKHLLEHPDLKLVYQWMLRTRDAQGVYAPLGFRTIVNPEQWMVIQTNRPVRDPFPGL